MLCNYSFVHATQSLGRPLQFRAKPLEELRQPEALNCLYHH